MQPLESLAQVAWVRVDTQTILTIHNNVITRNPRISLSRPGENKWWVLLILIFLLILLRAEKNQNAANKLFSVKISPDFQNVLQKCFFSALLLLLLLLILLFLLLLLMLLLLLLLLLLIIIYCRICWTLFAFVYWPGTCT